MIRYLVILNIVASTTCQMIDSDLLDESRQIHEITTDDLTPIKSSEEVLKPWFTLQLAFPPRDLSDFREVLSQILHHVDKTLFIKKFLEVSEKGPIVINQPIGWGKSFNLYMLCRFFEIEVDEKGEELPAKRKFNRVLFLGGDLVIGVQRKPIPQLAISKHKDIVDKYLGKFPVLFFSFKDTYNASLNTMKGTIAKRLVDLYRFEYPYLKKYCFDNETTVTGFNKTELKLYYDKKIHSDTNFANALRLLSYLLKEHFKQKVIVLIDDYDEPIQRALQIFDSESKQFKNFLNVVEGLLGALLKNNPNVERSLITGTFPFNDFGNRLDNLNHYTILQREFSKYYGFTEKEVAKLLTFVSTNTTLEDLRAWYNGYSFTRSSIYNPSSVLQCLRFDGMVDRYSVEEDKLDFLSGQAVTLEYQRGLQRFFTNNTKYYFYTLQCGTPSNDLYYFFLFGGYLNCKQESDAGDYKLSIPNYESPIAYARVQARWTAFELGLSKDWYYTPGLLLGHCKIKGFETTLREALNKSHSLLHFYGPNTPEDGMYLNGVILGLVLSIPADMLFVVGMEVQITGKVNLFIANSVTSRSKNCIIVEYKVSTNKNDKIAIQADIGAKSIELESYNSKLKLFPYLENVYKVFIVFRGNDLAVGEHKVPYPKLK